MLCFFQYCLETFHGRCPADVNLDSIYVILDGCPDADMQAGNQTFQALASIMGLHVRYTGSSWPEISRRKGGGTRRLSLVCLDRLPHLPCSTIGFSSSDTAYCTATVDCRGHRPTQDTCRNLQVTTTRASNFLQLLYLSHSCMLYMGTTDFYWNIAVSTGQPSRPPLQVQMSTDVERVFSPT